MPFCFLDVVREVLSAAMTSPARRPVRPSVRPSLCCAGGPAIACPAASAGDTRRFCCVLGGCADMPTSDRKSSTRAGAPWHLDSVAVVQRWHCSSGNIRHFGVFLFLCVCARCTAPMRTDQWPACADAHRQLLGWQEIQGLRNAAATHAFLLCNFGATGVTLRGMSRDFWVRFEICFAPQNVPNNI